MENNEVVQKSVYAIVCDQLEYTQNENKELLELIKELIPLAENAVKDYHGWDISKYYGRPIEEIESIIKRAKKLT